MTVIENLFEKEVLQQLDDCEAYDARLQLLGQEIENHRTQNGQRINQLGQILDRLTKSRLHNPISRIFEPSTHQLYLEMEYEDEAQEEIREYS